MVRSSSGISTKSESVETLCSKSLLPFLILWSARKVCVGATVAEDLLAIDWREAFLPFPPLEGDGTLAVAKVG